MKRLVSLALLAASCGVQHRTFPDGQTFDAQPAYVEVLARHTRTARVYERFEHRITATATLETPDYLEARFDALGRVQALSPAQVAERREAYRAALDGPSVILFLDAADPRWEDLSKKGSIWRLALSVKGQEWAPLTVVGLDESDPNLRHLFPWVGPFGKLYRVIFPPEAAPLLESEAHLLLAAAPAQVVLRFDRL